MQMDVYVNYRGNCEEAFRYYEQHLGGCVIHIARHGDHPNPQLPADWAGKVLHARMEIGGAVLMAALIFRMRSRCAVRISRCVQTAKRRPSGSMRRSPTAARSS